MSIVDLSIYISYIVGVFQTRIKAITLRMLSLETCISTQSCRSLLDMATAFGVSVHAL